MATGRPRRPRDPNQLAKMIADLSTGDVSEAPQTEPSARRAGGISGGKARAAKLTPLERQAIARKAAASRWKR